MNAQPNDYVAVVIIDEESGNLTAMQGYVPARILIPAPKASFSSHNLGGFLVYQFF